MGIPTDGGLRYVGRVGSGLTDKELDALAARFTRMQRKTSPFTELPSADAADAHFITPSIVGEVEFAEWSRTGKLRQPRWRGFRPDRVASDVLPES